MIVFIWFIVILMILAFLINLFTNEEFSKKGTKLAMVFQIIVIVWGMILIVLNW